MDQEGNHVIYSYIQEPSEGQQVVYQEEDQLQVVQDQVNNDDVVLNQGQEVLVYDDETGEYQQYYYVPENQLEDPEEAEQGLEQPGETIADEPSVEQDNVQLNQEESEAVLKLLENSEKVNKSEVKVLNQSDIHDLQPGTLIQCNKCWQTFLSAEFEQHYNTWHKEDSSEFEKQKARDYNLEKQEQVVIVNDPGFNKCAVCDLPSRSKKEYLQHYKSRHQGYKLGCPKCNQTYHSPELLQVHFKHFHDRETPIVQSAGPKRAHVMLRCEYCDDIVEDLENHLIQVHELDEPTAIAVTQDRPLQVVLDPQNSVTSSPTTIQAPSKPKTFRKPAPPVCLHCNICAQDFASQRDFTNHRRRKGYCRPLYPAPAAVREEPKQIRRIGIIRKLIKR